MRANTVGAPVPNGTDFKIHRLHRTEGALYSREVFVCLYRIRGAELSCWHAGTDDIDAVELGFSGNLIDLARKSEATVADVSWL